jgi:hypothetical protein
MKLYSIALTALLAIGLAAATGLSPHARYSPTLSPVSIAVDVTPQQLSRLDRATISATFSTADADSGPYTATLELVPPGGGNGPTATQGGFRLRHGQPLTIYWEWRADASLAPGRYAVHVQLSDANAHGVTSGTAPVPLVVTTQP